MVSNHSHKAHARIIMSHAPWLSLTEAKRLVPALQTAAGKRIAIDLTVEDARNAGLGWDHLDNSYLHELTTRELGTAVTVAKLIEPLRGELAGRDLVIFGGAGSGRELVLDAVLAASRRSAKIFQQRRGSFGSLLRGPGEAFGNYEIVVVDEQISSAAYENFVYPVLGNGKSRIFVVHGLDTRSALRKLRESYDGVILRNPLYLQVELLENNRVLTRRLTVQDPEAWAAAMELKDWEERGSEGIAPSFISYGGEPFSTVPMILLEASNGLRKGSDLVIYGTPRSGRSTLLADILEQAQKTTLVVTPSPVDERTMREPYFRGTAQNFIVDSDYCAREESFGQILRTSVELIALDNLSSGSHYLELTLENVAQRIIVVSATDQEEAREAIAEIYGDLSLRDPLFFRAGD